MAGRRLRLPRATTAPCPRCGRAGGVRLPLVSIRRLTQGRAPTELAQLLECPGCGQALRLTVGDVLRAQSAAA